MTHFHTHTHTHSRTHNHTDTHTHTHRGGNTDASWDGYESGGLRLHSREQTVFFGVSKCRCCRRPVEATGHWDRKSRAVSRSSTSSAAVASILAREKSLIGSPSTIFQVLFLISMGKE